MANEKNFPNGWKDGYSSADHATESYSPYAAERKQREALGRSEERERRMSEYNSGKTELVAHTNIVNCQTRGTINIDNGGQYVCLGGIVGKSYSNTTIQKCASYIEMTTQNCKEQFGGILGNVDAKGYNDFLDPDVSVDEYNSRYDCVNIEKCIFAGSFTMVLAVISLASAVLIYKKKVIR